MGWGLALLLLWAVGVTGAFLWLLARTVAKAASRKRHQVFSRLREVETVPEPGAAEFYYFLSADGSLWVKDDERRRECYRA